MHFSCNTMIELATGWFDIKEMEDAKNTADAARILIILGSVDIHNPKGL